MRRFVRITALFAGGVTTVMAGVALATPSSGLQSTLLARGAIVDPQDRRELGTQLLLGSTASDMAIVRATLEPGGTTGWHGHPEGSMVIVRTGTLTVIRSTSALPPFLGRGLPGGDRDCQTDVYDTKDGAKAFYHVPGPHKFVNSGSTQVEFYVAYFAPRGAGLLIDEPVAPSSCPT